jgi:hypothetical protein
VERVERRGRSFDRGHAAEGAPERAPYRRAAPPPEPPADAGTTETTETEVPFYRKVLAHRHSEDSGGFGPNWSNVDDYDIPTVLRKQMD